MGFLILFLFVSVADAAPFLSWDAPTQNEDGSPLTDLDGYKIYWGTSPGQYTNSVDLPDETVTTYDPQLPPGPYYFVATAYNSQGRESQFSVEALGTVQSSSGPVSVGGPVYSIEKQNNFYGMLPVGTVQPGVPCVAGDTWGGKHIIPVASVQFSPNLTIDQPIVVVGDCQ